jgi:hypothetical protein
MVVSMGKWLLAVLLTHAANPRTDLVLMNETGSRVVATIDHVPDGSIHGRPFRGGAVIVAERNPGDYGGELLLVTNGAGRVQKLCDGVLRMSTPLVADGRVFVERGRAGVEGDELRVDDLTVDEWTPKGLVTRWRGRGYTAHLAGAFKNEILIYAPNPGGTPLLAVERDTGRVRVVAERLNAPREFRVDGERLYFTQLVTLLSGRAFVPHALDLLGGGLERGVERPARELDARVREATIEVVEHAHVRQIAAPENSHIQIVGFVQ